MSLRFTIIDYTADLDGISTIIDEPVGWDGIKLRLKRDANWHGFFDFADDSVASLQFVGTGFALIKDAYEANGSAAHVELLIEFQCAEGDTWQQLYLGRFVFSSYKDTCGDECMVEIGLEAVNCMMIFKNRYDQPVDLDSLLPFDACACGDSAEATGGFDDVTSQILITTLTGHSPADLPCLKIGATITITGSAANNGTFTITSVSLDEAGSTITVAETLITEPLSVFTISGCLFHSHLTPYTGLNKSIMIPSKVIFLESIARSTESFTLQAIQNPGTPSYPSGYLPDGIGGFLTGDRNAWFTIPTSVIQGDLSTMNGTIDEYADNNVQETSNPSAMLNLDFLPICPSFAVRIKISFTGTFTNSGSADRTEDLKFLIYTGDSAYHGTLISNTVLYGYTGTSPDTQTLSCSVDEVITLPAGKSLFIYWAYHCVKSDNQANDPTIQFNNDLVIDLSSESECNSSLATVYMVNETLSRCAESYTNDCLRVYSNYYGRTDAQPYPGDADGCGGLRCITNGLRIRNAPNSDSTTPQKVTVSMKDMFDALNSIDNIGMGLEEDTNRAGYQLMRVEPQEYFYKDDVLMSCNSILKAERKVDAQLIFSTIKIGYEKWKTWNINGLNDIFTPRQYRTELSELKNELDKTCKFLASDYAIEWTRRQYGLTTADSRYDNDLFFLCLTREPYEYDVTGGFIAPDLIVLTGQNYQMQSGDQIQITGTGSNDGIFTVVISVNGPFTSTAIKVLEPIVSEAALPFHIASVGAAYHVEQGVDSSANILNPDTVLNYRLAPSRNMMRWLKTVLGSYRKFLQARVVFTNGEGNILGAGEVLEPCRLENDVITESQDLSLNDFATPEDNYPLFYPELVTFDYPLSYHQYLTIVANPYGLIQYQCGNSETQQGWIEDLQYSPYTGLAQFTLRPKIE